MSDDEVIKPCPFCGSKAEYDDNLSALYGFDVPGVECSHCGVRNFCSDKAEAIKSWNERVLQLD